MKFYNVSLNRFMSPIFERKIIMAESEDQINKRFENSCYINSITEVTKPHKVDLILWD